MACPPAQELLRLLLLVGLPVVASAKEVEVRVGLTLSMTGSYEGVDNSYFSSAKTQTCVWCQEVVTTIEMWSAKLAKKMVKTKANDTLIVRVDIRDDEADQKTAADQYEQLMDSGSDFLLGPAMSDWSGQLGQLVAGNGKVFVNWVSNRELYIVGPFETTAGKAFDWYRKIFEPDQGEEDEDEEDTEDKLDRRIRRRLLGTPLGGQQLPRRKAGEKACPAATAWLGAHAGELPPGGLSQRGMAEWFLQRGSPKELALHLAKNLQTPKPSQISSGWERRLEGQANSGFFDINVPDSLWGLDALQKVAALGAQKYLFLFFSDGPSPQRNGDVCERYSSIAKSMDGTPWSFVYPISFVEEFLLSMRVIKWVTPDVIFFCGQLEYLKVLMWGILSLSINPKAFIVDRPIGLVIPVPQAALKTSIIEPSPLPFLGGSTRDVVFGTLDDFVLEFKQVFDRAPTYASLQVTSALSLLLHALQNADDITPSAVTEYLHRQPLQLDTFVGDQWDFNPSGIKAQNLTSTRQVQLISLYDACVPGQTGTQTAAERVERNRDNIVTEAVSPEQLQSCLDWKPGGRFSNPAKDCAELLIPGLVYPALPYPTRKAMAYPCMPGCLKVTRNNKLECDACDVGKYHSWNNSECRDCPAGTYAHKKGMTACIQCPQPGSLCDDSQKGKIPLAKKEYFMLEDNSALEDTAVESIEFSCEANSVCGNHVGVAVFSKCRPVHVCLDGGCLDNNTGRSCGQCGTGFTWQGLRMGSRSCRKCPELQYVIGFAGIFVVVYAGLTVAFTQLGYWAALSPGYVPCLLARTVLHYFHMLGMAFEVTQLDAEGFLGYLLTPVDLLYRPLDLLMFSCLYTDTNSRKSIHEMSTFYTSLMPAGYVVIILGGCLFWFSNFIKNALLAVFVTMTNGTTSLTTRRTQKARKRTTEIEKPVTEETASESLPPVPSEMPMPPLAEEEKKPQEPRTSARNRSMAVRTLSALTGTGLTASLRGSSPPRTSAASGLTEPAGRLSQRPEMPTRESFENLEDANDSEESSNAEEFIPFSLLHGPGLNFNEHLESLAIQVSLAGGLFRACLAWTLLMYPVTLRGFARLLACDRFDLTKAKSYMVVNYDVQCYTPEHYDIVSKASLPYIPIELLSSLFCVLVPGVLCLYLRSVGTEPLLFQRRRMAVLFDGYRWASWEALQFLRTGITILVANWVQTSVRTLSLMLIVVIFFALEFFIRPFEPRHREAMHKFEMLGLIGVFSVLTTGQIVQSTEVLRDHHRRAFGAIVLVLNFGIALTSIFFLFVSRVSIKIQAIIESGSSVSKKAMAVHRFIQWYPGVSPVYFLKEGDSHFIDVSHLTSSEKTNLARILSDTVSVCIDQNSRFKTWVVERALTEAFRRAIGGRKAMLRTLYETFGTNNFKVGHLFQACLRSPDGPDHGSTNIGITVDELNDALMDVNKDIKRQHPSIFGQPPVMVKSSPESHYYENRRAKEWGAIYSIEDIIRDIMADNRDVEEKRERERALGMRADSRALSSTWSTAEVQPTLSEINNTVLDDLADEQEGLQDKKCMSNTECVQKLTEELRTLDKECQELAHRLQQAGGRASSASGSQVSSEPREHLLEVRKER